MPWKRIIQLEQAEMYSQVDDLVYCKWLEVCQSRKLLGVWWSKIWADEILTNVILKTL